MNAQLFWPGTVESREHNLRAENPEETDVKDEVTNYGRCFKGKYRIRENDMDIICILENQRSNLD